MVIALPIAIFGQSQTAKPPSAAQVAADRLAVFEGAWMQPDVPAGQTFRLTCGWLEGGRRQMVCRHRIEMAGRSVEMLGVHGYRANDGMYTLSIFVSNGQAWRFEGKPEGDRWVFNRVSDRPDGPRLRQIISVVGKDTLHFIEEVVGEDGQWKLSNPSEDYKLIRVR